MTMGLGLDLDQEMGICFLKMRGCVHAFLGILETTAMKSMVVWRSLAEYMRCHALTSLTRKSLDAARQMGLAVKDVM